MGNSQSSALDFDSSRRRSHRLSKPKTGNHATAGLLSPGGFSSNSKRLSNARMSSLPPPPSPASTPTTSTTSEPYIDLRPPEPQRMERSASAVSVQQKESRRRSLFRSRSTQGSPDSDEPRRQRSIGPVARVADRLGRASSMTASSSMTYESAVSYYGRPAPETWQPPAGSRTSWNYDMSSYEAKRLLNLTEEPRYETAMAMSENKMTVVTETTWKSSNPTGPPSTTISRANSDVSLYMPVRRRSVIQKPGVATRSNSTHESPALTRPTFRYSHPPTPSLSRQQSFESHRSGVLSMPPRIRDPDVPRVVTPCEDEYQSIGAFKLGSLRIVNGTASPVSPEADKSRQTRDTSQGNPSGRDSYFSRPPQREQPGTTADRAPAAAMKIEAPQPRPMSLSPHATSFLHLDVVSVSSGLASGNSVSATSNVPDYLADLTFSPFSLQEPPPTSPKLQTTSKATALDDHLFEDELHAEYSAVEVLDVREDSNAKLSTSVDSDMTRTVSRTDSGFASGRTPSEASHKPLVKADSGYSSNVSLRSFQSKAQERELTLPLEKRLSESSHRAVSVQSEERSLSSLSHSSHPVPPQREAPPPPVPPKDYPPISPTQSKASTGTRKSGSSLGHAGSTSRARSTPTPIKSHRSPDHGPKSPESLPRTPVSAKSTRSDRSTSALSIGSGSHKPSKLQRLLSSARRPAPGPLTVHATHVEEKASIPAIPHHVEHKLHEHSGLFPLTTRKLALKPRASLDTLKTIFSVGSVEASHEALSNVPSVPPVMESAAEHATEGKEASWRHTLQAVPTSIAHVAAHIIPKKPIPRKPVPDRQSSVRSTAPDAPVKGTSPETILVSEAELSTYTSVRTSLGENAYDAAYIAMASSREGSLSPQIVSRTLSITESTFRHLEMRSPGLANSPLNLPSPALPSPLLARTIAPDQARASPPVSMVTRRPASLRVPPPLRAQSSTASLSRKASRESIHSYPSAQPPVVRQSSRDSIRSHPAYPQGVDNASELSGDSPPIPPMNPRRISSFRHSQPLDYSGSPNWDVQTDHDSSRQASRSNSLHGGSRRNSLSSAPGQEGFGIQRPSSAQAWQVRTTKQQLRHRSSYDSWNPDQRRVQYGYAPSMSNGYTAQSKPIYDPWNSNSQFDPGHGQGLQDGRYPPYVPRGHHRNRSISRTTGGNPPYRVLHSYNSPAYRNAPIWG